MEIKFGTRRMDATGEDDLSLYVPVEEISDLDLAFSVLDAHRIKLSHSYDKLTSLSNSRTRLLPHQIEATHRVAGALKPRFILADEVGLGKTIEAGLIIKELMLRRAYKRVLVCVPAPLQEQWRQEMKSKFNEDFVVLNRFNYDRIAGSWSRYSRVITSIDFVKNPKYADSVLKVKWDIAVFDEAHRLRRDYSKTTKAYSFAEKMAERSEAFLLLSATPFRGKLEELYYLVRLVDPHIFGPHASFVQEYMIGSRDESGEQKSTGDLRERISRIMVRRRKVEVGGFTKRFACTIRFELSPEERIFYDEMTDYVRREYNLAMEKKNRAVGFVMIVFQKLLDSSTRALLRALEKRKIMLEQRLHGSRAALGVTLSTGSYLRGNPFLNDDGTPIEENGSAGKNGSGSFDDRFEEKDDEFYEDLLDEKEEPEECLDDLDRVEEDEALNNIKDLRKEILTVSHLIKLGRTIRIDKKLAKLKETIQRLKREGHPKFIIFTQFKSTQEYLAENLSEFKVTLFHGSLSLDQKEEAVLEFKKETEIFISTEAGGEGRNLQFANVLINYDLPWSPLKVEQRIGRIHRFGQESDVYIFNFSTRDTVAERILQVLEEKIRLFEESIGPSDALLGAVEDDTNFQKLLMSFVSGRKSKEDFEAEMDSRLKIATNGYSRLNELVTPQMIDFNLDDYYAFTRQERRIENEEIQRIVQAYLRRETDPRYELRKDSGLPEGQILLEDRETPGTAPATFLSEKALENDRLEFLAVGHPLVDRALEYFLRQGKRKALQILASPDGEHRGFYFVYILQYRNGLNRAELISCMVSDDRDLSVEIPDDLLIPPGYSVSENLKRELPKIGNDSLARASERALGALKRESEGRAVELKNSLHSIFKKEEYKLEISYFKKIRQLEDKRDRQRMRYRLEPKVENRAALTRTENELAGIRGEMDRSLERIRNDALVETHLELLQVYYFI